ncbi:MAG: hypothetical protein AMXMBFR84_24030 [Candidatus Hydrogenedentota bacterium]
MGTGMLGFKKRVKALAIIAFALNAIPNVPVCISATGFGCMEWEMANTPKRVTDYCPRSHRRLWYPSCCVLDVQGDRIFMQHGDLDGNRYYWEIRSKDDAQYFRLPGDVAQLAPEGYSAKLIPGNETEVLYRNGKYLLTPLTNGTF